MLSEDTVPHSAATFEDKFQYIIEDENIDKELQYEKENTGISQPKKNSKFQNNLSITVIPSAAHIQKENKTCTKTELRDLPTAISIISTKTANSAVTVDNGNSSIETKIFTNKNLSLDQEKSLENSYISHQALTNFSAITRTKNLQTFKIGVLNSKYRCIENIDKKTFAEKSYSNDTRPTITDREQKELLVRENEKHVVSKVSNIKTSPTTMLTTQYPFLLSLPQQQSNNNQQKLEHHEFMNNATTSGRINILQSMQQNNTTITTTNLSSNINNVFLTSELSHAINNTSQNQDKNCNSNNSIINKNNNNGNININNSNNNNSNNNEASGRSAALERAYVHDVYENCEEPTGPIRPKVAQFLSGLEPGSIVCDVGCGNGRYLTACNPYICTIGVDRCFRLAKAARGKGGEVALCDNLELPFRDESFDAVLSLAVVHHFATTERRVGAIRELARILRIGGRVIISVWALEQRHRRFESQDVLIPWQPPKSRTTNYSDEEDEDEFLPPYHAYMEDSTNSSRSAGDGDSSSLSSSSPGESCYSFVRRAIQKLAGGRKRHQWFLDSWTSKETKNDSSLDYEDAKDLPIELRRLEDFEDLPDPPLSAGLKSRSLGSILNPPPRQIVRSRSSVPSLGGTVASQQFVFPDQKQQLLGYNNNHILSITSSQSHLGTKPNASNIGILSSTSGENNIKQQQSNNVSPTKVLVGSTSASGNSCINSGGPSSSTGTPTMSRRPKLIKQKQSLCDDDFQLPDNPFHMLNNNNTNNNNNNNSNKNNNIINKENNNSNNNNNNNKNNNNNNNDNCLNSFNNGSSSNLLNNLNANKNSNLGASGSGHVNLQTKLFQKQFSDSRLLLRKQSSLNEELMAENRLREKERVRKRIQKQMSLNEAFLCRSVFTKRLQIIREGFTTKLKTSTGSLERVTKNSLVKIMKNFQAASQFGSSTSSSTDVNTFNKSDSTSNSANNLSRSKYGGISRKNSCQNSLLSGKLAMQHCITAGSHNTSSGACPNCNNGSGGSGSGGSSNSSNSNDDQNSKPRRHSRESGSDSSKDSSLQSDTSIESEDSFASVIFIPKQENQQPLHSLQQHYKCHQHNGNGASTTCNCYSGRNYMNGGNIVPSVPTSPLIMPCPPTPAHSPAALNSNNYSGNLGSVITSPPLQLVSGMLLSPPNLNMQANFINNDDEIYNSSIITNNFEKIQGSNRFTFDEEHILAQQSLNSGTKQINGSNDETGATTISIAPEFVKSEENSEVRKVEIIEEISPISAGAIKKKLLPKITRQSIKDLPPIPKFRKNHSLPIVKTSYPIIRRSSASPAIAKLQSLEIFNPATDDLDSDSSEASSPDSIDSVIDVRPTSGLSSGDSGTDTVNKSSASGGTTRKPETPLLTEASFAVNADTQRVKLQHTKKYHSLDLPNSSSSTTIGATSLNSLNQTGSTDDVKKTGGLPSCISKFCSINRSNELIKANQELLSKYSNNKDSLMINTLDIKNVTSNSFTNLNDTSTTYNKVATTSRQELIDFAEQLSAQLLKRLDADANKNKRLDDSPPQPDGDSGTYSSGYLDEFLDDVPYTSRSSFRHSGNEARDLADWREELRERRLNLANLSTQTSQRQSPISSSTSSLSSQTARSYTIHEEDEDIEAADSSTGYSSSTAPIGNLYENRSKNLKYKRNSTAGSSYIDYRNYSIYPETAYLIQDGDGDSLSRDDDDPYEDMDNNNVIPEEDEDEYDRDENAYEDEDENGYSKKTNRNTIRCQDSSDSPLEDLGTPENDARMEKNDPTICNKDTDGAVDECIADANGHNNTEGIVSGRESWALTNSSNSLDSPSQSGGSTTHHRYYHVFREGELDALINHHVTSLHIVSSYYERASWCVVAEKVQVWTI